MVILKELESKFLYFFLGMAEYYAIPFAECGDMISANEKEIHVGEICIYFSGEKDEDTDAETVSNPYELRYLIAEKGDEEVIEVEMISPYGDGEGNTIPPSDLLAEKWPPEDWPQTLQEWREKGNKYEIE